MIYSLENNSVFTTEDATDEQLMAGIQNHKQEALAELYRRHTPLLRSVTGRVLNNEHDVDEVVQETFFEIWRRAESYSEQKGKALGWIVTLARRRAIDKSRRRQAYSRAEERLRCETQHEPEAVATHYSGGDDTYEIFEHVLAKLPDAQRQALHLAFYRSMSQREIAALTGTPLGTVKTRIELGLQKVRTAILAIADKGEWLSTFGHS